MGLVVALVALLVVHPEGSLAAALALAIPAAIAWSLLTLHLPSCVHLGPEGISFSAYGREHRFAWHEIERVQVRRFIVRDRVLVRLHPSAAWRGRYWLMDSLQGFDGLVRELEQRAGKSGRPSVAPRV